MLYSRKWQLPSPVRDYADLHEQRTVFVEVLRWYYLSFQVLETKGSCFCFLQDLWAIRTAYHIGLVSHLASVTVPARPTQNSSPPKVSRFLSAVYKVHANHASHKFTLISHSANTSLNNNKPKSKDYYTQCPNVMRLSSVIKHRKVQTDKSENKLLGTHLW